MNRGEKLWVDLDDGIWRLATYEFHVVKGEPLGYHSVMLIAPDGGAGGRHVVCGCKTRVSDPAKLSPGPAGSVTGDSAEAAQVDSPPAKSAGSHGGLGESSRQRLLHEYTAERIDAAVAADYVGAPYREGYPTRERVGRWNREWLEMLRRERGEIAAGDKVICDFGEGGTLVGTVILVDGSQIPYLIEYERTETVLRHTWADAKSVKLVIDDPAGSLKKEGPDV